MKLVGKHTIEGIANEDYHPCLEINDPKIDDFDFERLEKLLKDFIEENHGKLVRISFTFEVAEYDFDTKE